MRCYMGDLLFMLWPLFRSTVSGPPTLHYGHWTIPTRNALVGCQPGHRELWGSTTICPRHPSYGKMGFEGSVLAQTDGPIPCNTFYPYSSQGTGTQLWDKLVSSQAVEGDRRGCPVYLWAPGRLWYLFKTMDQHHSDEHPGTWISQVKPNVLPILHYYHLFRLLIPRKLFLCLLYPNSISPIPLMPWCGTSFWSVLLV